jgi:hypothetical protein
MATRKKATTRTTAKKKAASKADAGRKGGSRPAAERKKAPAAKKAKEPREKARVAPAKPGASAGKKAGKGGRRKVEAGSRVIIATRGAPGVAKLGHKWLCYSCGAKFYDLGRDEPLCPKCGADQRQRPKSSASPTPAPSPRRPRPMAPLLDDDDDAVRYDEAFDLGIRDEDSAPEPPVDGDLFDLEDAEEALEED